MHFDFTPDETDYIAKVLSQRPFAEVANLIGKMQQQVQEQQYVKHDAPIGDASAGPALRAAT